MAWERVLRQAQTWCEIRRSLLFEPLANVYMYCSAAALIAAVAATPTGHRVVLLTIMSHSTLYYVLGFGSIALISRLTNWPFSKSEHFWRGLKPVYKTYSNIMIIQRTTLAAGASCGGRRSHSLMLPSIPRHHAPFVGKPVPLLVGDSTL